MDIPELDAQEDISRQIASAPTVRTGPVMNIAELESADLFRLPALDKDHAVDLSLLTACLCPADQVSTQPACCACVKSGLLRVHCTSTLHLLHTWEICLALCVCHFEYSFYCCLNGRDG